MHAQRGRSDHPVGYAWFWVWALVGFAIAIGLVSLGCLFVAGLQRGGGNLDARPWFLAGFVLAAVGIAGHALRRD
jgi:hypothetical protein